MLSLVFYKSLGTARFLYYIILRTFSSVKISLLALSFQRVFENPIGKATRLVISVSAIFKLGKLFFKKLIDEKISVINRLTYLH